MSENNDVLKKVLKLILDQADLAGNEWLKAAINSADIQNISRDSSLNLDEIGYTLKKKVEYLNDVETELYNQGQRFYKDLIDDDLKAQLVNDYMAMIIASFNGNVLEYGRRMNQQLELLLDSVIKAINAWEIIDTDEKFFQPVKFKPHKKEIKVNFKESFFMVDKATQCLTVPLEISQLKFIPKLIFCCEYYGVDYSNDSNWSNIDAVNFLRNKASHGLMSDYDKKRVATLQESFSAANFFYMRIFKMIVFSFKVLFNFPAKVA